MASVLKSVSVLITSVPLGVGQSTSEGFVEPESDASISQAESGLLVDTEPRAKWVNRESTTDVLSRQAQKQRGFRLTSLDADHDPQLPNPDDALANPVSVSGLIPDTSAPIGDQVQFKIDFGTWFGQQPEREQAMMTMLAAGHSPSWVTDEFGVSRPRMSQLRKKWAREWLAFIEPELAEVESGPEVRAA